MSDSTSRSSTWSARRDRHKSDEKGMMGEYCAQHDFLVAEGKSPETDNRETVASIYVNSGTTPNVVVQEILKWIKDHAKHGPFDITWYTSGALIPATLRAFRLAKEHENLQAATQIFLFPGRVDPEIEAVTGPEAVAFANNLKTCFTYEFLSAFSFDLDDGSAYFNYDGEVSLQRACAMCYSAQKFLFLDSSKFKREGYAAYTIEELLRTAETVTIYTVSSPRDSWIKGKFERLCDRCFGLGSAVPRDAELLDTKCLRLRVVGRGDAPSYSAERRGILRDAAAGSRRSAARLGAGNKSAPVRVMVAGGAYETRDDHQGRKPVSRNGTETMGA